MSDNKKELNYEELANANGGVCFCHNSRKANNLLEAWVTNFSNSGWEKEAEKIASELSKIGIEADETFIEVTLDRLLGNKKFAHIGITYDGDSIENIQEF